MIGHRLAILEARINALEAKFKELTTPEVLQGWFEIARYLRRSVGTVQRWARIGGLPVMKASKHGRRRRAWTTTSLIDLWIVKNSG